MKHLRILIPLTLLLILTISSITSAQDDDLQDLDFALTFVPNIQFAPVYVAQENGYFTDAGFNITVDYIEENVIVDLIATGDLQLGVVSGEQVLLARGGGRPVVYVYEWFQQYPVGIVIPNTTDAVTISDLQGMTVGVPGPFGATYSGLTALLTANGLDERDIQLESIGFVAPDIVCAGRVQASAIYVNNEPLQIQQRADAGECGDITSVTVIPVASEVDLVSNGLVTSEATIAENPDLISGVIQAFHQGLVFTINNPAEAYLLSEAYVEGLPVSDDLREALEDEANAQRDFLLSNPTREDIIESRITLFTRLSEQFTPQELIQFHVMLTTIDLWEAEILGMTDAESWQATYELLNQMEMLLTDVDINNAYTNDFVPAMSADTP